MQVKRASNGECKRYEQQEWWCWLKRRNCELHHNREKEERKNSRPERKNKHKKTWRYADDGVLSLVAIFNWINYISTCVILLWLVKQQPCPHKGPITIDHHRRLSPWDHDSSWELQNMRSLSVSLSGHQRGSVESYFYSWWESEPKKRHLPFLSYSSTLRKRKKVRMHMALSWLVLHYRCCNTTRTIPYASCNDKRRKTKANFSHLDTWDIHIINQTYSTVRDTVLHVEGGAGL